ncbi:phage integrase family protein [Cupriavidus sp. H18C2]|uniref:phage integrase family protein n=1 Tax=Cupriavidus sp. H18C2 TaxID=3241602 RepID=UPI003BF8B41D
MAEDRDTIAATKLTRTEFAVVRAYAQGMRPVDIANRYLLDPDDDDELTEHQAVQRILALRDRLVQFALQHDRPDIAEMFEALRGRSDSGMTRRVEALSSIEQLGQGRPQASHRVTLWFGPSLARRLTSANVHTIADLVDLANRHGSSWWRHVPRIGRHSCETIVRWLAAQRPLLDTRLREFVQAPSDVPHRASQTYAALGTAMAAPAPLEWLREAPGEDLTRRKLAEDLSTVRQWLRSKEASPNTWKSYRREAERLLLWAARRGQSLRDLADDDLQAYREFLADPQPADFWCGPASARDKVHWRPFEGPLGERSREAALRVVRLVLGVVRPGGPAPRARRRPSAPAAAGSAPDESDPPIASHVSPAPTGLFVHRFFDWLATDATTPQDRAALAAALLIARHGLRIVELPLLRYADVVSDAEPWRLSIPGKRAGGGEQIELGADVRHALFAHWQDRGMSWQGLASDGGAPEAALLAPVDYPGTARGRAKRAQPSAGYSASGLDRLLRATWRRFAAAHADVPAAFTPRQLRLA